MPAFTINGYSIEVTQREPEDPREGDNLTEIVLPVGSPLHLCSDQINMPIGEMRERQRADLQDGGIRGKGGIYFPLYVYRHGCTRISIKSFQGRAHHAEWDSALAGYVWATPLRARRLGIPWRPGNEKGLARIRTAVEAEVEALDAYLNGEDGPWTWECAETGESGDFYDTEREAVAAAALAHYKRKPGA